MLIGNQEVSREQMPSYISPQQQPYHMYQSMQDTLQGALSTMQAPQMQQPKQKDEVAWKKEGDR